MKSKVDHTYVCKIFESCSAINFVSSLGASATPEGFFNLQSNQGVTLGRIQMNFTYIQDDYQDPQTFQRQYLYV